MPIHTVLGTIEPERLGWTSFHEHVFVDARVWGEPPREEAPEPPGISLESHGFHRWNLTSVPSNLVLDDEELAIRELGYLRAAGGTGLVDMTSIGLGRKVSRLVDVARATGLHIMVGTGFYV